HPQWDHCVPWAYGAGALTLLLYMTRVIQMWREYLSSLRGMEGNPRVYSYVDGAIYRIARRHGEAEGQAAVWLRLSCSRSEDHGRPQSDPERRRPTGGSASDAGCQP